uniref:Uncharacterized protein n=1 Tax=Pan troglodytes TaxID=9598 RepID=A0A2I3SVZ6_PANTR
MLTLKPPCPLPLQSQTSPSTSPGREMSEKLLVYTKLPVPCVLGWWLLMSRQTFPQVENHEDLHAGKTLPLTTIPGHMLPLLSAPLFQQNVCSPHPLTPGEAQTQISPVHGLLGAASISST